MKTINYGIGMFVVWALTSSPCFADLIINQPKAQGDGAIQINWNSETNAIYQIESIDDLTATPWITRETQFASQGTNTVWLDVGDSEMIPRLYYPSLNPTRFYCVSKIGTASSDSPAISLSFYDLNGNPITSTTVSGFLRIAYNANTASNILSEVETFVDGQVVGRGYDTTGSAWVNTTEWVNGNHKIWSVARSTDSADSTPDSEDESDSGDVQTGVGVSSVQTMGFDNFISQYFVTTPYFDVSSGQIQEITAQFKQNSTWYLFVLDANNNIVVAYTGQGTSLYVVWDGTDGSGNEVSDGFYDYYIEATPTSGQQMNALSMAASTTSPLSVVGQLTTDATPPVAFQSPPQALATATFAPTATEFQRDSSIQVPAMDNHANNPVNLAPTPTSAISGTQTTEGTQTNGGTHLPPLPPMSSVVSQLDDIISLIMPPSLSVSRRMLQSSSQSAAPLADVQPLDGGSTTYYAYYPLRQPGAFFKGFAGAFGVGYQGHHPSWIDTGFFSTPSGAGEFTSTWAPYGKLKNASGIANAFSSHMATAGWRRSFLLADDTFSHRNLTGGYNEDPPVPVSGDFAYRVDLGLLVGHVIAAGRTPYGASMCYLPLWHTGNGSYDWIAMPEMDFGQNLINHGHYSPLKWMGLYGCNSLRLNDVNDMWTKFLLPMPPNLRLLLGSDSKVFIVTDFGSQFADDLNGVSQTSGGSPMSIIASWYDAGMVANTIASHSRNPFKRPHNPVVMSVVFRDSDPEEGLAGTAGDSIWNYPGDFNQDYIWIDWQEQTVYSP